MEETRLTEDEIEIRSNSVRRGIAELLNTCIYSLKEACDSQKMLREKMVKLEVTLKPFKDMKNAPNFQIGLKKLGNLKNRVGEISSRLKLLNNRMNEIEKKINGNK